jgi:very-short-patch-repair endonuclease
MKCVDFVVVQRDTMHPLLVVELDDSSHKRAERQKRDQFVDQVLTSVGIPVLHWRTSQHYSRSELSQTVIFAAYSC